MGPGRLQLVKFGVHAQRVAVLAQLGFEGCQRRVGLLAPFGVFGQPIKVTQHGAGCIAGLEHALQNGAEFFQGGDADLLGLAESQLLQFGRCVKVSNQQHGCQQ